MNSKGEQRACSPFALSVKMLMLTISEGCPRWSRAESYPLNLIRLIPARGTKIGGKVYAIAGDDDGEITGVSFKVTPIAFHILKEQPGCRGAPHLASRGMKWIQRTSAETMSDDELLTYLRDSYRLVAAGLTKKLQKQLGLSPTVPKGFPS